MLLLYCQQFAFAPEMVPACAPLLSCQEKELHYGYSFNGSHYTQPDLHITHLPEPQVNHQTYYPEPYGIDHHYDMNV